MTLLFLGVSFVGCGEGSTGGGGESGDTIRVTDSEQTLVADDVRRSTTHSFEEGSEIHTTLMGGWISGSESGVVTVRVTFNGEEGQPVGPGTYTIVSDDSGAEPMTANLALAGVNLEGVEDLTGVTDQIVGVGGTLDLHSLELESETSLGHIDFEFDGSFLAKADLEDPAASAASLSGSARYSGE